MDEWYYPENAWMYSAQAENALIGCILVAPEKTMESIRGIVSAGDFQTGNGKAVYLAAAELIDEGAPCDPVLIQERAAKRGLPLESSFCAEAMGLYKTTANVAGNKHNTSGRVIFVEADATRASSLCFLLVLNESPQVANALEMEAPILSA